MKIYGIILAAGEGKRAGGHKLSREINSKPMLYHVVEAALRSDLFEVILVTGAEKTFGEKVAQEYGIKPIYNPDYVTGMSSSLKTGLAALPEDASGFAVLLGDMPYIKGSTIAILLDRFSKAKTQGILIPTYKGRRGHPPIFSISYKDEILAVTGDKGARDVIARHPQAVYTVEIDDLGIISDVDCFLDKGLM